MSGLRASRNAHRGPTRSSRIRVAPRSSSRGLVSPGDEERRRLLARHRRLSMNPDSADGSLAMVGRSTSETPSRACSPDPGVHREHGLLIDERHSRYAAERVPGAVYVETTGRGQIADEIEQFLHGYQAGAARPTASWRPCSSPTRRLDRPRRRVGRSRPGGLARASRRARREHRRENSPGEVRQSLGDSACSRHSTVRAGQSAAQSRFAHGVREPGSRRTSRPTPGDRELLVDDDIGGLAVHSARGSAARRPGGGLLVRSTVRDLIVGSDRVLADRGEHELRGIPGAWRIFEAR